MSKEEDLKEAKERIVKEFNEAIEGNNPFIVITENDDTNVFSMAGNPVELARMFLKTMERSPEFKAIVNVATTVNMKVSKVANRIIDPSSDNFNIQELKDDLDCEGCDKKDDCEILKQMDNIKNAENPMEASIEAMANLIETHPFLKPKAQA